MFSSIRIGVTSFLVLAWVVDFGCSTTRDSFGTTSEASSKPIEYAQSPAPRATISKDAFLSHIALLAHDDLEGRGTGSDGIDLAGGYIAGQLAAAGVRPGGPHGTYFQEFTIDRDAELTDDTILSFSRSGESPIEPKLRTDYVPFGFSTKGEFEGDLVFAGYGITYPDKNHDDYAGVDVAGKVVLLLRREPESWRAEGGNTEHATFQNKVALALKNGAKAVLVVNQEAISDEEDSLMPFRASGDQYALPAMHITRKLGDQILVLGGSAKTLAQFQKLLDAGKGMQLLPIAGVNVTGKVAYKSKPMRARNVIGVLPGMGLSAGEYVIIGAHYDHLGERRGRIYNGADDNASGTAGVIELARALAEARHRNRSVILMAFTGEEIGLLGSRHYTEEPTVPITAIKAMINMDMIGRHNPDQEENKLAIQGLGTGGAFKEIVERRAAEAGIGYIPDESALGPSDHDSFYRAGVPSLFFFTGVHADYHQPGDDTEKVNAEGGARITELVYAIAMDLINAREAPQYAEVKERAIIFRGTAGAMRGGVVMGIAPDMEDESDEPGWRVGQVTPGLGAAKAGMKAGDRILAINDVTTNDMADFRTATSEKKPGDVVDVRVRRGKDELSLSVELTARSGFPGPRPAGPADDAPPQSVPSRPTIPGTP